MMIYFGRKVINTEISTFNFQLELSFKEEIVSFWKDLVMSGLVREASWGFRYIFPVTIYM